MSDLADCHRRIADVVEPLERMGVDAGVDDRARDDGDLCLTLDLRIPPALDPIDSGEAPERIEALEAECEQLRAERDALQDEVDGMEADLEAVESELRAVVEERDDAREHLDDVVRRAEDLEARIAELEDQYVAGESDGEEGADPPRAEASAGAQDDLTDGERETLDALRELGGSTASGAIAGEVDATLQSVRSWLPRLVQAGHIRTEPDPTDGRRKLYSPVECDEPTQVGPTDDAPTDDADSADADGTVHIASNGGSPSQVFHVRAECPQLQKSADSVRKDRSVVPHHRPCGTCVPGGLGEGLVAIAEGSPTTTYHKREDCPKLGSANDVAVRERETVPDYDPCGDCVPLDGEEGAVDGEDDGAGAARICARNDVRREELVEALDAASAIYHVQRDLTLSREETEALLRGLGVFEDLEGGGHVTLDRANAVAREHVPPAERLGSDGDESRD